MPDLGGQQNNRKVALETEKLVLEKRLLLRQLSRQGLALAWLQAASVPAALVGAILAFYVGSNQLRQGADNQVNDRFDKALTRLASIRPDERMTGVSGVNLFLRGGTELLQKQALVFLVNALSLEKDERVQGAILDALADLPAGGPSQAALDEGLRTAIQRNRSLTRSALDEWPKKLLEQQKRSLTKFKIADLDVEAIDEEIPAKVLSELSVEQYLSLLEAEQHPLLQLEPAVAVPLGGLSVAVQTLVARGATASDFSEIYCAYCKFSQVKFPKKVVFDKAFLIGANFSHAELHHASFKNADVGGASFFGADMTEANLSADEDFVRLVGKGYSLLLPQLECAKLVGADLSGLPLVLVVRNFTTWPMDRYTIMEPSFTSAQLDQTTKLDRFSIVTAYAVTDAYVKAHLDASEVRPLMTNRNFASWSNPFDEGASSRASFRRFRGTFAEDASSYATTTAYVQWSVDEKAIKRLGGDAFMIRWYIDQPALSALPLYAQFKSAVQSLDVPKQIDESFARQKQDESVAEWKRLKPSSCDGDGDHDWFNVGLDLPQPPTGDQEKPKQ